MDDTENMRILQALAKANKLKPDLAAKYPEFADELQGYDLNVTTPAGDKGAWVYRFTTHERLNRFLDEVGGAPYPSSDPNWRNCAILVYHSEGRYRVEVVVYQMSVEDPDAIEDVLCESIILDTEDQESADVVFKSVVDVIWDNADSLPLPDVS